MVRPPLLLLLLLPNVVAVAAADLGGCFGTGTKSLVINQLVNHRSIVLSCQADLIGFHGQASLMST